MKAFEDLFQVFTSEDDRTLPTDFFLNLAQFICQRNPSVAPEFLEHLKDALEKEEEGKYAQSVTFEALSSLSVVEELP
jgi:hypothetical protein